MILSTLRHSSEFSWCFWSSCDPTDWCKLSVTVNAICFAGAVVHQQVVKLQQQLVDLQSSFVEEQRKALWVILCHHLHLL